jgi:RNA polymerase sigma-70 factor (ECF subfamily)
VGTDRDVLARVASGDKVAMDVFVRQHQAPLWRLCLALTHDASTAEDVLQDTFVAVLRHADGFHGESARPWLFLIARNAVRRRHRLRAGEPRDWDDVDALALRAGWGDTVFEEVAEHEAADQASRALAALDEDDRALLTLRDLQGWTGAEVAAALDLPLATMKTRLHRARLRWMAAVREEVGDAAR